MNTFQIIYLNNFIIILKMPSIEKTRKLYWSDTYLFKSTATLISIESDSTGFHFIFDTTIFYPQGGGQPSDIGKVTAKDKSEEFQITFVREENGIIKHYSSDLDSSVAYDRMEFILEVDEEKRIIHSKLHTAGHLLGNIIQILEPALKKKKGYHFPDGPCIECYGKDLVMPRDQLARKIEEMAGQSIQASAKVTVTETKEVVEEETKEKHLIDEKITRFVQIDGFDRVPCGGTHLKNLNELAAFKIRKIIVANGNLKFCYSAL